MMVTITTAGVNKKPRKVEVEVGRSARVIGPFTVHRAVNIEENGPHTLRDAWRITHNPTGKNVGIDCDRLRDAVAAANALLELRRIPWDSNSEHDICDAMRDRETLAKYHDIRRETLKK